MTIVTYLLQESNSPLVESEKRRRAAKNRAKAPAYEKRRITRRFFHPVSGLFL